MESGCHIEGCERETILFCFDCRKWFCKDHYSEHQAIIRLKAKALFPA
jgi:hypothetical protein